MESIILGGAYRKTDCGFKLLDRLKWDNPGLDCKYSKGFIQPSINPNDPGSRLSWGVFSGSGDYQQFGILPLLNFVCDGCTAWPDRFFGISYRKACFIHDFLCRHVIKTHADRYEADRLLMYLVGGAMGRIMFVGVRAYSKFLEAQGRIN